MADKNTLATQKAGSALSGAFSRKAAQGIRTTALGKNTLATLEAMSALSGAFSSFQQAKARREIARSNALIEDLRAKEATRAGMRASLESRKKFKRLLGKQRAAMAAQGIRTTAGSAQDIIQETQDISELDALTISLNASRKAFGHEAQAESERMSGRLAFRTGRAKAASTLLVGGIETLKARRGGS